MFYFVRHGKTDYSERDQKIYQGFGVNLAPLSEIGIQQIQKTSKDDRLQGADIILSSPYTRALQTAAILSKELNAPIAVETDLHEWLANKAYIYEDNETAEKAYLEYESLHGKYPDDKEKAWEDAETIKQRVLNVLKKYSKYNKVIVACHGMMIQATTGSDHPQNGEIVEFDLSNHMEYPLTLYFDTEVMDVEIKDSSHGDSDFRKAYIVNDGTSKIVIKYFSNAFSDQKRIMGWFRLMDEYRKIGLYCPAIIPNRYGELLNRHTVDGRDYYVYAEEFSPFQTAAQLNVEKRQYMPDVLRSLGVIASKRLDFLDFPSEYCLLEPFSGEDTIDEVTECALLFVDYIKKNLPQHLSRAERLLDLFYKNQEECRKVYDSLPSSCFQADLNSSNILLDDNLKFVGLFDFNLCGKEKILNYAMREALWATYQDCLVDKDNNYIFYFDKTLDDFRMKAFLENMSYIQQTYTFSNEEKKAFPILLRYINTFWWFSLSELEFFSKDDSKVEKMLDWLEHQMNRDDITLL